MSELGHRHRIGLWDVAVAVAGTVGGLVALRLTIRNYALPWFETDPAYLVAHLACVGLGLMLLVRRRWPVVAALVTVVVVAALAPTVFIVETSIWLIVAGVVVVSHALGAYGGRGAAATVGAYAVALATLGIWATWSANNPGLVVPITLGYPLFALVPALAGLARRLWRDRLAARAQLGLAQRERMIADQHAELKAEQARLARDACTTWSGTR